MRSKARLFRMSRSCSRFGPAARAALLVPAAVLATGCGMVTSPMPPSLKLPTPAVDLTGARAGDEVTLHWTMPKRDTEKVMLKGDQRVVICRHIANGPCQTAGDLLAAPEKPASYTDHLPPGLVSGPARLLGYSVELKNHAGQDAGPSNMVYLASGDAPTAIEDLAAHASAEGVVLSWKPQAGETTVRIHRELDEPKPAHEGKTATKSKTSTSEASTSRASTPDMTAGVPAPDHQLLEFTGADQGHVLDRDAALDHTYTYEVDRVTHLTLSGHEIEIVSGPSTPLTLNARDTFPPAVPGGLQAVGDADAGAIDLSWSPDNEADVAGYRVYRRDAASSASPVRISTQDPVAPSFRDPSPQPGHRYAYSVSAVDHDGNESARSAEVEEGLPQP